MTSQAMYMLSNRWHRGTRQQQQRVTVHYRQGTPAWCWHCLQWHIQGLVPPLDMHASLLRLPAWTCWTSSSIRVLHITCNPL